MGGSPGLPLEGFFTYDTNHHRKRTRLITGFSHTQPFSFFSHRVFVEIRGLFADACSREVGSKPTTIQRLPPTHFEMSSKTCNA